MKTKTINQLLLALLLVITLPIKAQTVDYYLRTDLGISAIHFNPSSQTSPRISYGLGADAFVKINYRNMVFNPSFLFTQSGYNFRHDDRKEKVSVQSFRIDAPLKLNVFKGKLREKLSIGIGPYYGMPMFGHFTLFRRNYPMTFGNTSDSRKAYDMGAVAKVFGHFWGSEGPFMSLQCNWGILNLTPRSRALNDEPSFYSRNFYLTFSYPLRKVMGRFKKKD